MLEAPDGGDAASQQSAAAAAPPASSPPAALPRPPVPPSLFADVMEENLSLVEKIHLLDADYLRSAWTSR